MANANAAKKPTEIAHPIDMSTVERVELEALLGDLIDKIK